MGAPRDAECPAPQVSSSGLFGLVIIMILDKAAMERESIMKHA